MKNYRRQNGEQSVSLLQMPEVIFQNLLNFCDYRDTASLRKTCSAFRSFIIKVDHKNVVSAIYVKRLVRSVILKFRVGDWNGGPDETPFTTKGRVVHVEYSPYQWGCAVFKKSRNGGKRTVLQAHYLDVFFNDFNTLMDLRKDTVFEELRLDFDPLELFIDNYHDDLHKFITDMEQNLRARSLVKTKVVSTKIRFPTEMMSLLSLLDSEHLKTMKIEPLLADQGDPFYAHLEMPYFDRNWVEGSEQWEKAEHLKMTKLRRVGPWSAYLHFKTVHMVTFFIYYQNVNVLIDNFFSRDDPTRCFHILVDAVEHVSPMHLYYIGPLVPPRVLPRPIEIFFFSETSTRLVKLSIMLDSFKITMVSFDDVPETAFFSDFDEHRNRDNLPGFEPDDIHGDPNYDPEYDPDYDEMVIEP